MVGQFRFRKEYAFIFIRRLEEFGTFSDHASEGSDFGGVRVLVCLAKMGAWHARERGERLVARVRACTTIPGEQ